MLTTPSLYAFRMLQDFVSLKLTDFCRTLFPFSHHCAYVAVELGNCTASVFFVVTSSSSVCLLPAFAILMCIICLQKMVSELGNVQVRGCVC